MQGHVKIGSPYEKCNQLILGNANNENYMKFVDMLISSYNQFILRAINIFREKCKS